MPVRTSNDAILRLTFAAFKKKKEIRMVKNNEMGDEKLNI